VRAEPEDRVNMQVWAITGGMGAGKSRCAAYLASRGAAVIDADAVAKAQFDRPDVLEAVVGRFGPGVLGSEGTIQYARLAEAAFASPETALSLDAIVHPLVVDEIELRLDVLGHDSEPPELAVIDIPLLSEVPTLAALCDVVVLVTAPQAVRLDRLQARGVSKDEALRRMALQPSDDTRRELAHVVVDNSGTEEDLEAVLDALLIAEGIEVP
jgi:dephospho-CoA kinase